MDPSAPVLRLFAAIEPDTAARAALAELQAGWWSALTASDGVRLVPDASLHLTVRFFGSTPAARVDPLREALAMVAARATASEPTLQRLEYWPPRAPRVVVAAFDTPPALATLAAAVEAAARGLGFAPEPRPFRAHVTLARCRGRPLPRVAVALPRIVLPARRLALFESRTLSAGPVYIPLAGFPLSP